MTSAELLTQLLITGLATARITALLVEDDLLESIRHRVFTWSPPPDDLRRGFAYQNDRDAGFIGSLFACHYCTGVWVAAATYGAISLHIAAIQWVIMVAAIAAVGDTVWRHTR